MRAILDAALEYARRGWLVLPLAGKVPRLKDWPKQASADAARVAGWWSTWPDGNVGIATGPATGLWVLDVDAKSGGLETLAALETQYGALTTMRARTGSGGLHLYFLCPAGLALGNRVGALPGIDVRAAGGQVVAPPSVHPDTHQAYTWDGSAPAVAAPVWLLEMLRPPAREVQPYSPPAVAEAGTRDELFVSKGLRDACQDVVGAGEGARHKVLHDKAVKFGGYVASGLVSEDLVVAELQRAGEAAGKSAKEVARTVRDGVVAGKQRPLRPNLGASTSPSRDEVMAWWAQNQEASSREAAERWGVPAATLRRWAHERQQAITPPDRPPVGAITSPDRPPDRSSVAAITPLDRLTDVVRVVAEAEAKAAKSDPLYDLLGDREWLDAMVALRMEDASAGVADLGRLGEAFHGARQLVRQIEEAIKARKKAVVDEAREAARKSSTPPPLEPPVPAEPHDPQDKPEIPISTDMPWVVDQAIRALRLKATLPLYQRGGMLVQLTRDSSPPGLTWDPDAPSLRPVRHARLREMMSASARWMKMRLTQQGWEREPALPPVWAVDGVLARDEWPVRRALGVTEIPILRADGTVHDVDGYDDVSGYIHTPPRGLRLEWPAEALGQDLARRAYLRLCDPLIDFPFESECHRAAAIAALLSLVARPAIDGPCPLFPVLSTTPKSGKTFMVEILHLIATGREIARMAPGETEEEIEKRITMVTLAGFPAVLLDNLTGSFGGPSIDSVVQGRVWHGRILGRTESVYLPARAVWFVTGNNLGIKGDLAQRVIPVQLAPQEERPELRTNFVIPKLREYVKANRADLLTAAFTLLRCHAAAGRPVSGRPFGGYDDWNQVVRGALLWAGAPDPYAGVEQLAEVADERRDQTRAFLESWYDAFVSEPVYLGDLVTRLESGRYPDLGVSAKAIAGTRTGDLDPGRLGYFCRQTRGRPFGAFKLEHAGEKRHGARAWRVRKVQMESHPPSSSPSLRDDEQIPY